MKNHVPDRRHSFVGERVARETRRKHREVVGMRDANEDTLDVVNALENRTSRNGAVRLDTPEREEAHEPSTVDSRKDRNAVTPDQHDARVVDSCRNPVRRVNHQEASSVSTTSSDA